MHNREGIPFNPSRKKILTCFFFEWGSLFFLFKNTARLRQTNKKPPLDLDTQSKGNLLQAFIDLKLLSYNDSRSSTRRPSIQNRDIYVGIKRELSHDIRTLLTRY